MTDLIDAMNNFNPGSLYSWIALGFFIAIGRVCSFLLLALDSYLMKANDD